MASGSFQNATELAVEAWGRDPKWETQEDDPTGAPHANDGEALQNAPVSRIDVKMRENLRRRTARITLGSDFDETASNTYTIDVRQQTASYTYNGLSSSNSTTRDEAIDEILKNLQQSVNQLKEDVRAYTQDPDNDNEAETLVIESAYTIIEVVGAQAQDYTIDIGEQSISYTAAAGDTLGDIMDELAGQVNQNIPFAKAFRLDTEQDQDDDDIGDGSVDLIALSSINHGDLNVSVDASSNSSDIDVLTHGYEAANPHISLNNQTGLPGFNIDLDAARLDAVRFYGRLSVGESDPPGGWRLIQEWTDISYRGLTKIVRTGGLEKGYVEVVQRGGGSIRSIKIGPSTLE